MKIHLLTLELLPNGQITAGTPRGSATKEHKQKSFCAAAQAADYNQLLVSYTKLTCPNLDQTTPH